MDDKYKYNTVQNLIDILYVFFQYNEMKNKHKSTDDEMFWIGYNIYMVINYTEFLYKMVPRKVTYLIFDIYLHDDTPYPYLYSILFKDQTIIKKLQEKIPEILKPYKVYLDVDIFKTIRQDLIYFYNNYNAIKERDDLYFQHITDGYNFLTSTLPDDDNTTFIEFLKRKEQSSKLRKSRNSRTPNGPWRSVSSKGPKKSKKKKSTLISKLKRPFMRKTRKN